MSETIIVALLSLLGSLGATPGGLESYIGGRLLYVPTATV